jgi:predicted transcriptional regulator of viral defense system
MNMERHGDVRGLAALLDSLQERGRYCLTRDEAASRLSISDDALTKAAQRLVARRRLVVPRRGFWVIVPLEHRQAGAPPPDWYITDLMVHCGCPYYVGLLSAAALHGAGHQQPQEFQVVTDVQQRPAAAGRGRMRFFRKLALSSVPVVEVRTETGSMRVSTPEATALDLLRYLDAAGQVNHVATVLADLAEAMDPDRLLDAARLEQNVPNAQRLGFLLDLVGAGDMGAPLAEWVAERRPRYLALRPDRPLDHAVRDPRWRVLVNATVEADD